VEVDLTFFKKPLCYRQVLPITTVTVQKPSLLKTSQARIQSNIYSVN